MFEDDVPGHAYVGGSYFSETAGIIVLRDKVGIVAQPDPQTEVRLPEMILRLGSPRGRDDLVSDATSRKAVPQLLRLPGVLVSQLLGMVQSSSDAFREWAYSTPIWANRSRVRDASFVNGRMPALRTPKIYHLREVCATKAVVY